MTKVPNIRVQAGLKGLAPGPPHLLSIVAKHENDWILLAFDLTRDPA
jgi:hypothetical protein